MNERLVKNVAIAKSGIYKYTKDELPNLGVAATPPCYEGVRVFNVYRPSTVLERAAHMFVKLPLTLEHPNEMVSPTNFKRYVVGYTGDSASTSMSKEGKEVLVKSSLVIADAQAMRAYYSSVREVSPGYTADFAWEDGVAPSGEKYQIVMKEITSVNHLALVRHGRGGSAAAILDHQ